MRRGILTHEHDVREAYAAHSGELYSFAVRALDTTELAEEAVQEAFLRAWRQWDLFNPEIGDLRTWLFGILRDAVIDLGSAGAARPRSPDGDVEPSSDRLQQSLLAWQVEEAIGRVAEPYRQALVETYYRGRPYAEVANELGVSEGTVKSRVYNGLRALKEVLREVDFES